MARIQLDHMRPVSQICCARRSSTNSLTTIMILARILQASSGKMSPPAAPAKAVRLQRLRHQFESRRGRAGSQKSLDMELGDPHGNDLTGDPISRESKTTGFLHRVLANAEEPRPYGTSRRRRTTPNQQCTVQSCALY